MWNEVCSKIFSDYIKKLNNQSIRYFVLRNYEELPENNTAKDIDIVVDPKREKDALDIIKSVYKENGLEYYDQAVFEKMICTHGMSVKNNTGIHIDLIAGYISRGYEIYSFEELYAHVISFKNFYVLDELMDGVILLVYKIFGYKKPKLKNTYRKKIYETYVHHSKEYQEELAKITNQNYAKKIIKYIKNNQFDEIIRDGKRFSKHLREYSYRKNCVKTVARKIRFLWQKANRIIFSYRKHRRVFAVLAPDGTGKTTFLNCLIEKLNHYYVSGENDGKFHIYHFRPNVFPNLGEIGEKTRIMEQDTNFTDPHRNKAVNPISSMIRMVYYMLDYIIGWQKCVRNDVRCDRYSIFDRYSYDFIIDPLRSKINLPEGVRKFLVKFTPKPPIVFVLKASAETIYSRKQELPKKEIERQLKEYEQLANSHKRFFIIDAEKPSEEMAMEALQIIFKRYCATKR